MNNKCGMLNGECGRNFAESVCARSPFRIQHSAFSIRPPRGLTLIELLVTIVIMVTVLAGVLPMISPNNNSRKIREASRQLSSLMAQAQAQAARDGRAYGVGFREFDAGGTSFSGMSLEAFTIAEPQPFAGFSEWSRVSVALNEEATYGLQAGGNAIGNEGEMFDPKYRGARLWKLHFSLYGQPDLVPPRMIRNGDVLHIDRNVFLIVDDGGSVEGAHQVDPDTGFLMPMPQLNAIWLNNHGQQPPAGAKPYSFRRQPTNTSDAPLQFPRGIGIDLAASGAEGVGPGIPGDFDREGQADVTGIMFSPNGALDAVYFNGTRHEGVEQVFMLMGLVENGNGTYDSADFDFSANPATPGDNAEMAGRRSRINWLNSDSRWVTANRAGRIITSENNTSFNPSTAEFMDGLPSDAGDAQREQRRRQINNARLYARQMTGSSGR